MDYDGDLVYGNVASKSIIEVFNSDKMNDFRRRLIAGENIPAKCSYCTGRLVHKNGALYISPRRSPKLSLMEKVHRNWDALPAFLERRGPGNMYLKRLFTYSRLGKKLQVKYWKKRYL